MLQLFNACRINVKFLATVFAFHFSVQFLRLVISITDKWKVTIVSQYLKFFVVLLQSLMSSLCRVGVSFPRLHYIYIYLKY